MASQLSLFRRDEGYFESMSPPQGGPPVSVITPCLNGARYLVEAIESVLVQRYPNVEHIVVDGGSTDGTLEVLRRYPHVQVINGPDRGMYDALNKGLTLARGEIIGVLNSDDCYAADALATLGETFRDDDTMALVGEAAFVRQSVPDGEEVDRFIPTGTDLLELATLGSPAFNAWFFRRSVFARIGRFDAEYRIAGDRDFMLRFALSGLRFAKVDRLICRYRIHPDSLTMGGKDHAWEQLLREHIRMTDLYLRKPGLSPRARRLIRQVRTRDTLKMAIRSARRRELGTLISYSLAGMRSDPLWAAGLVKRAAAAIVRRIARI
jgi:glycosyltransferase involved in cell wall biosynthesis